MANDRWEFVCTKCGEKKFFGKTMGDGIYSTHTVPADFLEGVYDWMWQHLTGCSLMHTGEPFKVASEMHSEEEENEI